MRLKDRYTIQEVCGMRVAVSPASNNMVTLSESGAYIFSLLGEETTEAEIIDALCNRYDAPREVLAEDFKEILAQCREAGLLEE